MIEDIESGSTLSEAMAKQPKAFDNLYVNMVKAGEAGGALEIILQRLAEFKERSQSLKRKVQGAMIYPVAVITVATGIVGFIMYWIIPKFKKIFQDFGIDLPGITKSAHHLQRLRGRLLVPDPGNPAILLAVDQDHQEEQAGGIHLRQDHAQDPDPRENRREIGRRSLRRTLGTLISSGVPILEGLIIARDTAGNAVFRRAFDNIYAAIREGETMAVPLKEARIVDDLVVNMVDVGEETGALDTMLYKIADVYDEEVSVLVEGLINLLEPMMVVILGLIVGFIVIALFMPLIKLLNSLA